MHQVIQRAATGVGVLRVALGVVAVGRPDLAARPWVGASHDTAAGVVLARAAGARDIALGAGAVLTASRGDARGLRDWTAAGAFCDVLDLLTTLLHWQRLPRTRALVAVAAGGAAVLGAAALAGKH